MIALAFKDNNKQMVLVSYLYYSVHLVCSHVINYLFGLLSSLLSLHFVERDIVAHLLNILSMELCLSLHLLLAMF